MSSSITQPLGMFALIRAVSSVQDFIESKLAVVGLSVPKLAALQRLSDASGALPLGQLADRLACVKSNVTQLIDRLEADGLVTRAPDPTDRRSRLAVMTEAGRRACQEGARVQREVEEQLFSALTADEAARLTEIMFKLKRASA
jgi:DNA-binding MarR family transcriptional regulator